MGQVQIDDQPRYVWVGRTSACPGSNTNNNYYCEFAVGFIPTYLPGIRYLALGADQRAVHVRLLLAMKKGCFHFEKTSLHLNESRKSDWNQMKFTF